MVAALEGSGSKPHGHPRRLWIVSELFYPEETSTGRILTQLAEGLRDDCRVSVLCGQPNYSHRGERAPWHEIHDGIVIHRCWATRLNKDHIPCRFVNAVTLSICILFRLLVWLRKDDQVLVVTTPPTLPFVAVFASWLYGSRCTVLVHDVYPDVAVAAGVFRHDSLMTRLFRECMDWPLRLSTQLITLGRDMDRLIKTRLDPEHHKKMVIIPNWAELDTIRPKSRAQNRILEELGIPDRLVLQYSGNMGRAHNVEDIVTCAERLSADRQLHFLLVGSGAKKSWLLERARQQNLRNITVCDEFPRQRLEELLNACDVAVISLVSGMAGISVPCRTYNILAAGKPIIAISDPDSELAMLVREERIGWVISPAEIDALTRLLTALPQQRAELAEMGRRARVAAEKRFSFSMLSDEYRKVLFPHRPQRQVRKAA